MKGILGRVAAVVGADSATTQALFSALVAEWGASGARIAGLVAEAHGLPDRTCAAGILRDIRSARTFPIYLAQAPSGTSCHLDASGVDAACAAILGQIAACDLVVLSKFGKLEAAGSGLVRAFGATFAADKPVLTSVSPKHLEAWRAFAPRAISVPAESAALQGWWSDQRGRNRPAGFG